MLAQRLQRFGGISEPLDIWRELGIAEPAKVPMLDAENFVQQAAAHKLGAN
jgi:malonate decarboxylase beta subunit